MDRFDKGTMKGCSTLLLLSFLMISAREVMTFSCVWCLAKASVEESEDGSPLFKLACWPRKTY